MRDVCNFSTFTYYCHCWLWNNFWSLGSCHRATVYCAIVYHAFYSIVVQSRISTGVAIVIGLFLNVLLVFLSSLISRGLGTVWLQAIWKNSTAHLKKNQQRSCTDTQHAIALKWPSSTRLALTLHITCLHTNRTSHNMLSN